MKQFEYKQHNIIVPFQSNIVAELCKAGNEGWELVRIEKLGRYQYDCIFKREITEEIQHQRKKKQLEFLDKQISELHKEGWISVRVKNVLDYAEIDTPRKLIQTERSVLLGARNFGKKSLTELDEFLEHFCFHFGQDLSEYEEVSHD